MGIHHKTEKKEQFNSLDQFNSLMTQASQSMSCDSECQRKKTEEELKQKYLDSQTNLATAPDQVSSSMTNYMVFADGTPAYNEYLDNTLETKAIQIATEFKDQFTEDSGKIVAGIKTYDGLLINLKNVVELYAKYKVENLTLIKQLKDDFIILNPVYPTEFSKNELSQEVFREEDKYYSELWQNYHYTNATLRILCKDCNQTLDNYGAHHI